MSEDSTSIIKQTTPAGPVSDFIIMGTQAAIWIFIMIISIFKNIDFISFIENTTVISGIIITLILITILYSLGIIIDLLSSDIYEFVCKKSRDKKLAYGKSTTEINFYIMKENQYIHYYLTGLTSRLRIAKSLLLNYPLIILSLLFYSCLNEKFKCYELLIILLLTVCIWLLIKRYCIKRDVHYHNSMHIAFNVLNSKKHA